MESEEISISCENGFIECYKSENIYGQYCIPRSAVYEGRGISECIVHGNSVAEPRTLRFLSFISRFYDNPIVVDAGSYIGDFLPKLYEHYFKIYSFEPHHINFRCLEKTIEWNDIDDKIEYYNLGLSDV